MAEKDEKPWTLTIRLPREMEARIRRLASERLVQPSVVVRQLVKERLDEMEREEARRQ
jgi:predicted DNA-binding protein